MTALHSEKVENAFVKGVDKGHALSEFLAGLRLWLLSRTLGEYDRCINNFQVCLGRSASAWDSSAGTEVYPDALCQRRL
jgi:hypothetical protein